MIFYREEGSNIWDPCWKDLEYMNDKFFKHYDVMISKKVYTERSPEFEKAFESDQMWDSLMYRPPEKDGE